MAFKRKIKLPKSLKNKIIAGWLQGLFAQAIEDEKSGNNSSLLRNWKPLIKTTSFHERKTVERIVTLAKHEISNQLGFQENDIKMHTISSTVERKQSAFSIGQYARKYAAVAALVGIVFGVALFYTTSNIGDKHSIAQVELQYKMFETNLSAKKQITLPDGSTVYMNRGSRLKILSAAFNKKQREVWLDEGEAFFQVTKNPQKPFIVHAAKLTTTVKGTSFNVKAYSELDESSVMVRTGRVEVNSGTKTLAVLTPDKQLVYHKNNEQYEESEIQPDDAMAWWNDRLVLRKANIAELKLRIKQLYGVEMVVQGDALDGKYISSSFEKNTELEHIIESICMLHDVQYKIVGKQVIIFR